MTNTPELPEPILDYFAADRLDGDALACCFTNDAIVKDEGRTFTGIASIKRWKAETSAKYIYTSEPFALERKDDLTIVTSHLTGSFPGSPIDLRYIFRLERGKIAYLEIRP